MNKAMIIGNLAADPEQKTISNGNTVCTFSVGTSKKWKDKDGHKQERTEWHRIVFWGKQAEVCGKYLQKGSLVYVCGRLETRSWEDPNGVKKYTTEIIGNEIEFLSKSNSDQGGTEPHFDNEELPF